MPRIWPLLCCLFVTAAVGCQPVANTPAGNQPREEFHDLSPTERTEAIRGQKTLLENAKTEDQKVIVKRIIRILEETEPAK